jgi:hypothetical protein
MVHKFQFDFHVFQFPQVLIFILCVGFSSDINSYIW